MARYRSLWAVFGLLGLGLALVAGDPVPSREPALDRETTRQLTAAAGALVEQRSAALVRTHRDRTPPDEILGVRISPQLAQGQERAVRELENRGRAPVAGGPVYTRVKTRLDKPRATRRGDRITLDALEVTEMRYATGKMVQSVRRRFEFTTRGERIVLVREGPVDPSARPLNDAR